MTTSSSPTLKVEFDLSDADLDFFRDRLDKARESLGAADESRILSGVSDMLDKARASNPPVFVKQRLDQLGPMLAMLEDKEWKLEGEDRKNVLDALAYFADPDDLIPDATPVLGYVDDAIMIDLVAASLTAELEAYADFVAHREDLKAGQAKDLAPLDEARDFMQQRMRRRRMRARASGRWPHATTIRHYF
ncbi:YkvA family protein [Maricaulis sp.]|uniref:YkvA family protein n=1 Tax=Maricaulis sp. TaxID=1486257 RepID=UPI00260A494F|nr:YkvA family protein [Maricaulis sp.]